jgi:hypothetical protein
LNELLDATFGLDDDFIENPLNIENSENPENGENTVFPEKAEKGE